MLEIIKKTAKSRIINLTSSAHKTAQDNFMEDMNFENGVFDNFEQYSNTKLANLHFSFILQNDFLNGTDICTYSVKFNLFIFNLFNFKIGSSR